MRHEHARRVRVPSGAAADQGIVLLELGPRHGHHGVPGAAPATAPEEFPAVTEHAGRIGTRRIGAQAAELQSADEAASAD